MATLLLRLERTPESVLRLADVDAALRAASDDASLDASPNGSRTGSRAPHLGASRPTTR